MRRISVGINTEPKNIPVENKADASKRVSKDSSYTVYDVARLNGLKLTLSETVFNLVVRIKNRVQLLHRNQYTSRRRNRNSPGIEQTKCDSAIGNAAAKTFVSTSVSFIVYSFVYYKKCSSLDCLRAPFCIMCEMLRVLYFFDRLVCIYNECQPKGGSAIFCRKLVGAYVGKALLLNYPMTRMWVQIQIKGQCQKSPIDFLCGFYKT